MDAFPRVFLSHSSRDATEAEAFVGMLRSTTGLKDTDVRCSSVAGYRLPYGSTPSEILRREIEGCEVLLGFLTPASLASEWVLFELGAAWALKKTVIPLLAPGVGFEHLPAAIHGRQGVLLAEATAVAQLLGELAQRLGLQLVGPSRMHHETELYVRRFSVSVSAPTVGRPVDVPVMHTASPSRKEDELLEQEVQGALHRFTHERFGTEDTIEVLARLPYLPMFRAVLRYFLTFVQDGLGALRDQRERRTDGGLDDVVRELARRQPEFAAAGMQDVIVRMHQNQGHKAQAGGSSAFSTKCDALARVAEAALGRAMVGVLDRAEERLVCALHPSFQALRARLR